VSLASKQHQPGVGERPPSSRCSPGSAQAEHGNRGASALAQLGSSPHRGDVRLGWKETGSTGATKVVATCHVPAGSLGRRSHPPNGSEACRDLNEMTEEGTRAAEERRGHRWFGERAMGAATEQVCTGPGRRVRPVLQSSIRRATASGTSRCTAGLVLRMAVARAERAGWEKVGRRSTRGPGQADRAGVFSGPQRHGVLTPGQVMRTQTGWSCSTRGESRGPQARWPSGRARYLPSWGRGRNAPDRRLRGPGKPARHPPDAARLAPRAAAWVRRNGGRFCAGYARPRS